MSFNVQFTFEPGCSHQAQMYTKLCQENNKSNIYEPTTKKG